MNAHEAPISQDRSVAQPYTKQGNHYAHFHHPFMQCNPAPPSFYWTVQRLTSMSLLDGNILLHSNLHQPRKTKNTQPPHHKHRKIASSFSTCLGEVRPFPGSRRAVWMWGITTRTPASRKGVSTDRILPRSMPPLGSTAILA